MTFEDAKELIFGYNETADSFEFNRGNVCGSVYNENGKPVLKGKFELRTTHKEFIHSFGKYDFVRLLARSAFHYSAQYKLPLGNDYFIFDCSKFFERLK